LTVSNYATLFQTKRAFESPLFSCGFSSKSIPQAGFARSIIVALLNKGAIASCQGTFGGVVESGRKW
jgi:hypothetical protein